jgi:hypothetical protein
MDPEDAPPGLQEVAALVMAARTPSANRDLVGEAVFVSELSDAIRSSASWLPWTAAARRKITSVSAKSAGVAALVVLGISGAAAATGLLPSPVQRTGSSGLAHLGISVLDPAQGAWAGTRPREQCLVGCGSECRRSGGLELAAEHDKRVPAERRPRARCRARQANTACARPISRPMVPLARCREAH